VGRAGTGPSGGERPTGTPGAAVHRHILDRVNAINDSLKKKRYIQSSSRSLIYPPAAQSAQFILLPSIKCFAMQAADYFVTKAGSVPRL